MSYKPQRNNFSKSRTKYTLATTTGTLVLKISRWIWIKDWHETKAN